MLFFSLLWRDDCCFSLFFGGMTGAFFLSSLEGCWCCFSLFGRMLVLFFSLLWRDDWCCFSLFFGGMTGAVFLSSL